VREKKKIETKRRERGACEIDKYKSHLCNYYHLLLHNINLIASYTLSISCGRPRQFTTTSRFQIHYKDTAIPLLWASTKSSNPPLLQTIFAMSQRALTVLNYFLK
jgi:hypothetical protein